MADPPPHSDAIDKLVARPKKPPPPTSAGASGQSSKRPRPLPLPISPGRPLSYPGEVAAAILHLRSTDPAIAPVIDSHDPPSFVASHPPFLALTRSILYQQLAFKAAAAVYTRFLSLLGGEDNVSPCAVLGLDPVQLRQIGVSPRKASYLHDLARKYATGILSDEIVERMDDRSLAAMLTMVKGIGSWSVHMFMIFSLHRPDVLPAADLGVRKGVQLLYGLDELPRPSQMEKFCERWRPYRSVGAWYMWRLIESRPQALGLPSVVAPDNNDGIVALHHQQLHEQSQHDGVPQLIDPLHMLPGLS